MKTAGMAFEKSVSSVLEKNFLQAGARHTCSLSSFYLLPWVLPLLWAAPLSFTDSWDSPLHAYLLPNICSPFSVPSSSSAHCLSSLCMPSLLFSPRLLPPASNPLLPNLKAHTTYPLVACLPAPLYTPFLFIYILFVCFLAGR